MSHALPATMTEALQFSPMGAGMWTGDAETSNVRAIPYVGMLMTSSFRVSNAKARNELGWSPNVASYREGVPIIAPG